MSAETIGWRMPPVLTLDDLTAMMAADEFHRYEISPEGVLSVMPPPGTEHATIASQIMFWLAAAGMPANRVHQTIGLRIPGRDGGIGGRIPDLVVWSRTPSAGVWVSVDDALLVVEIVSPGSKDMDTVTKRAEYAAAGIPQYWVVGQDATQTVTMHRLTEDRYEVRTMMPLAWVLNTKPAEHDLV
ncbi:Uma2 family endonuclease [Dactylosporangium sp. CA-152071]|uniref:Uma2 family endonuclease n=1 Tax=Dactylosporangium sp. CA-152071 TaxID=3239933 RepID=UPI003D8EF79D